MTPKQQRFVQEYLIDLNATQAAIRAGYTPTNADVTGPRLLGNVGVAEAIEAAQQKVAGTLEIDAAAVITDLEALCEAAAAAGQYSAAIRAKELVGKHGGMFIERRETTITDKRTVVRAPSPSPDADSWRSEYAPPATVQH